MAIISTLPVAPLKWVALTCCSTGGGLNGLFGLGGHGGGGSNFMASMINRLRLLACFLLWG